MDADFFLIYRMKSGDDQAIDTVVNLKTVPGGAELRVLSPVLPGESAVQAAPTLEDVFLYYFGERAGEDNGVV